MKTFAEELFKKLDSYERIDNIHDINSVFNDSLRSLPNRLQSLGDYITVKFIGDIDADGFFALLTERLARL